MWLGSAAGRVSGQAVPLGPEPRAMASSDAFPELDESQDPNLMDRPVHRSRATPEELQNLTVDEALDDIERAIFLLSTGQDCQRTSAVANLPMIIQEKPTESLKRVVPKIGEILNVAGVEIHLIASHSFLTILQEKYLPIDTYCRSFLKIIMQNLEHKDPGVCNAYLEVLLLVIEALPEKSLKNEILGTRFAKSQLLQSVHSRLASCIILGKLASKFKANVFFPVLAFSRHDKSYYGLLWVALRTLSSYNAQLERSFLSDILPLVKSHCQDVEHEVRSCMCRQLEYIAHGIGAELTKTELLPELVELSRDEGMSVRLAAFETMVNLLSMLDRSDKTRIVLPLLKTFCEKSIGDETVLASLSSQFGKLMHGLQGIFSMDQKLWFLEFYRRLCRQGLQEETFLSENQLQAIEAEKKCVSVRKNAAFNFPAITAFVGSKNFQSQLSSTFVTLCHDPAESVRSTMAKGLYEVTRILSPHAFLMQKELIMLLQDDSLEVLDALLERLPETLELMVGGGDSSASETKLLEAPGLISALTAAEQTVADTFKWRSHEHLLKKYECLPRIISSDQIYFGFLQRVFEIVLTTNVKPVQQAAARTLCVFLRYNRKQEQRGEIVQKIIDQLGHGKSYRHRLRFLDTCGFVLEIFSKEFFCSYFFVAVLELTNDPVANVRRKVCLLLPKLKSTLKLPAGRSLLQQLESCVRKLLSQEKDKDVLEAVKQAVVELDNMESLMDVVLQRYYEEDLSDEEKEKEERLLYEKEQSEIEKQLRDEKASKEKLSDKKRRNKKTAAKNIPTGASLPPQTGPYYGEMSPAQSSSSRGQGTSGNRSRGSSPGRTSTAKKS